MGSRFLRFVDNSQGMCYDKLAHEIHLFCPGPVRAQRLYQPHQVEMFERRKSM